MNKGTGTAIAALGGVVLVAFAARSAAASSSTSPSPAPSPKKPVRGVVTFGEPTIIKRKPGSPDAFAAEMDRETKTPSADARAVAEHLAETDTPVDMSALDDESAAEVEQASVDLAREKESRKTVDRKALQAARLAARDALQRAQRGEPAAESDRLPVTDDAVPPIPADALPPQEAGEVELDAPNPAPLSPPLPINLERARKTAPDVAKHIKKKGAKYNRHMVKQFQQDAGIVPDGLYGPVTASALRTFGVLNSPPVIFKGTHKQYFMPAPASASEE